MKKPFVAILLIAFLPGLAITAQSQPVPSSAVAASSPTSVSFSESSLSSGTVPVGRAMKAIQEASTAGKLLFLFFHEATASQPGELQTRFESLMAKEAASASWVVIDRKEAAEKDIVAKYQIQRAPMPLILAIAPNGAVTTGFPGEKLSETAIRDAFVSKGLQTCLAPLQEGKLVILCLQNAKTSSNEAAMTGVKEFAADVQYNTVTEIVTIDPADPAEASLFEKIRLTGNGTEAQTILLAPPAVIVGQFKGAVTKAAIMDALKAAAPSGGGCGPSSGGCGPSGCK